MLVGFTGIPGSGKSYSAGRLLSVGVNTYGMSLSSVYGYNFGDLIKSITLDLFPEWNNLHTRGELKEIVDKEFDISPRRVMQIVGKSMLEINKSIWSDIVFRKLEGKGIEYQNNNHILVTIDDIRYPQDFDAIKARGGMMVGLVPSDKSRIDISSDNLSYDTEKHSEKLVEKCDYIITNDYGDEYEKQFSLLVKNIFSKNKV